MAKHRSLAGHSKMAKRLARWMPGYSLDDTRFFGCDGASAAVQQQRRAGFERLAQLYRSQFAASAELTAEAAQSLSDLQFTASYRVPYPFSAKVRDAFKGGSLLQASDGVLLTDLDGNRLYDLGGSYGVNLLGYDTYKLLIEQGQAQAKPLGPVLGSYHPVMLDNLRRLKAISGLDQVSFHMSGTEAVMQAVRLARYHTGRKYLVRFCGAYHGWWEDVQPGIGNPLPPRETYTLKEMDDDTLRVLSRRKDIACVLVNPLQALHPNANAPSDSQLVDSSRRAGFQRDAYTRWLQQLREVCSARGIVLIFDEVFVGFRLAPGGAQQYFGVQADLVTYGKTLGGGLPVGVVCGKAALMKRWRDARPADICFARGTFNAHPYVMTTMNAFLRKLDEPAVQAMYAVQDSLWDARARMLNLLLQEFDLPLRVDNLQSIWTISYLRPSRYNWMLQYYLRAQGLALPWIGTGRFIFSLNYTDADFDEVVRRLIAGCHAMQADGWWSGPKLSNQQIKRQMLREVWELGVRPRLVR